MAQREAEIEGRCRIVSTHGLYLRNPAFKYWPANLAEVLWFSSECPENFRDNTPN